MQLTPRLRWLWLTLLIVVLDRASKAWFEVQTSEGWRHEVVAHFIYLVHSQNPGIAFSIFAGLDSAWLRYFLIVGTLVVIAVLAWMLVSGQTGVVGCAGLALLLGGATGNLTDRILRGGVTDFLEVWIGNYRWPAFNLADSAITIGAILLIVDVLFLTRQTSLTEK
ncbi:MAG TPA: signal peptidase II [Candidatus Acidoferrum sp.]|nr:signal peptidase II [Candidatus Acidoferrum sp.]